MLLFFFFFSNVVACLFSACGWRREWQQRDKHWVQSCSEDKEKIWGASRCQAVLTNTAAGSDRERSPASLWETHNSSVFAFGRKTFVSSHQQSIDRFHTINTHICSFHTILERERLGERDKASLSLPTVNISFQKLYVYTVKTAANVINYLHRMYK